MIDLLGLVIVYAAAARAWHLGATDKLSLSTRERAPDRVATWLECHRCGGFWWALAVVGLYLCTRADVPTWVTRTVDILLIALAVNWAFVASRELIGKMFAAFEKRTAVLAAEVRRAHERMEWPA